MSDADKIRRLIQEQREQTQRLQRVLERLEEEDPPARRTKREKPLTEQERAYDAWVRRNPPPFQREVQQLMAAEEETGERPARRARAARPETEIDRLMRERDAPAFRVRAGDVVSVIMDDVEDAVNFRTGHLPARVTGFTGNKANLDFFNIVEDEARETVALTALRPWRQPEPRKRWRRNEQVQVRDDGQGSEATETWWDARVVGPAAGGNWRIEHLGEFANEDGGEVVVAPERIKSADPDVAVVAVQGDPFEYLWEGLTEDEQQLQTVARKSALPRRQLAIAVITMPTERTEDQAALVERAKGRKRYAPRY